MTFCYVKLVFQDTLITCMFDGRPLTALRAGARIAALAVAVAIGLMACDGGAERCEKGCLSSLSQVGDGGGGVAGEPGGRGGMAGTGTAGAAGTASLAGAAGTVASGVGGAAAGAPGGTGGRGGSTGTGGTTGGASGAAGTSGGSGGAAGSATGGTSAGAGGRGGSAGVTGGAGTTGASGSGGSTCAARFNFEGGHLYGAIPNDYCCTAPATNAFTAAKVGTTGAFCGSGFLQITAAVATNSSVGEVSIPFASAENDAGKTLAFAIKANPPLPTGIDFYVFLEQSNYAYVRAASVSTVTSTWTPVTVTVPSGTASSSYLVLQAHSNGASYNGTLYLDEIDLR